MAVATATFSEPTRPTWGMYAADETAASRAGEQPWSSFPIARQTSPSRGASNSGTAPDASSTATTRNPSSAAALAAAAGDGSRYAARNRSGPSEVLPTAGRSRSGVLPHSQTDSTPNAAAVRTIEPTLNGWLTESSSSARRPSVRRRHSRLSRFTSVGRSCLGGPPAVPPATPAEVSVSIGSHSGPFEIIGGSYPQQTVAAARGQSPHLPSFLFFQPAVERVGAQVAAHHQRRTGAGRQPGEPPPEQLVQGRLADPDRRVGPDLGEAGRQPGRVGGGAAHVRKARPGRVPLAQRQRPFVHVDRPDRRRGGAGRHRARDRPVAAAEVEQVTGRSGGG